MEEVKKRPPIVIEDYNPKWVEKYNTESQILKNLLEEKLVEIHHIGSTSVPGLAAKPIIDIIATVKDLNKVRPILERGGYKYRGEFNLPFRSLYQKKGYFEIYLHVHEVGSPEIQHILGFKNYLIKNKNAQREYENIKKEAALNKDSNMLTDTGITRYNLYKNDFIEKIINKLDIKGTYSRFCTQKKEWDAYKKIRSKLAKYQVVKSKYTTTPIYEEAYNYFTSFSKKISIKDNIKHLILYNGKNVVAASELEIMNKDYVTINFIGLENYDNQENFKKILNDIEKWAKLKNYKFVIYKYSNYFVDSIESLGYKITHNSDIMDSGCSYLMKAL